MDNRPRWMLVLLVCGLAAWAMTACWPLDLGLDIRGGTRITYEVPADVIDRLGQEGVADEAMEHVVRVISIRIDGLGMRDLYVRREGDRGIVIGAPHMSDTERSALKERVLQLGKLAFLIGEGGFTFPDGREAAERQRLGSEGYEDGSPYTLRDEDGTELPLRWLPYRDGGATERRGAWVYADPEFYGPGLRGFTGRDIEDARSDWDETGQRVVIYDVKKDRRGDFGDYTERYVGKPMAIVLNDEIWSAPVIRQPLYDTVVIEGGGVGFTEEEQRWLDECLDSGSLMVKPEYRGEENISASLGARAVTASVTAAIVGFAVIVAFLLLYYRFGGVVAVGGLGVNMFLLTAVLAFFDATLTLPGLAGILLTIGMAVDANILIFERIREELDKGKPLRFAIRAGYDRAFVAIMDANLTTLLTAAILYHWGVGPIRGFAVTLMAGTVCTLFSALFVTRTLFNSAIARGLDHVRMRRLLPARTKVAFLSRTRPVVIATMVMVLLSVVALVAVGSDSLGLDFTGGTLLRVRLAEAESTSSVAATLRDAGSFRAIELTGLSDHADATGTRFREVEARLQSSADVSEVRAMVAGALGDRLDPDRPFAKSSHVGPSVVADLTERAIVSVIMALLGLTAYIWFRFKDVGYGIAAALATAHDVVVSLGTVVVANALGIVHAPLNLPIVAGFLTILGYSLNDTIVLFDRVRENHGNVEGSFRDVVNRSINQTLSRTLLTSMTTFLVVAIMLGFNAGHESAMEGLAFTLLVGVVAGTWSSIFVAAPVLVWLRERRGRVSSRPTGPRSSTHSA